MIVTLFAPGIALAQGRIRRGEGFGQAACRTFLECLPGYIEMSLGFLGVLALAGIIWGIYNYLIAKGNQARLEGGRHAIVSSLLLLVALVIALAIFRFFRRLFGI